jgi:hypothetical protein
LQLIDNGGEDGRLAGMPRQMPHEFAGALHPVMNRRDRLEEIFRDVLDRRLFLATLTEACEKTQWQIHAYCPNRLGWDAAALRQARQGEERKVRLAARNRTETTLSLQWIAEHLALGRWPRVSNLLGAKRKRKLFELPHNWVFGFNI